MKRRRTPLFQPHQEDQEPILEPPPPPPQEPPPPPPKTTRPWSKLPLPFVKHLLRRLQIPDYIRFSSVCHPWHISKKRAQTLPSQQQLPWFLLPRHVNEPSLTFYSLSESRSYRFPVDPIFGSECFTAVRGWLLFEPNFLFLPAVRSCFILNPLRQVFHTFPDNPLMPDTLTAVAIIDSPSPNNPQNFWIFFSSGSSIIAWNPDENIMFRKDFEAYKGYDVEILDMTAEGDTIYYINDDLDLIEYGPFSSTEPLILNFSVDFPPLPSMDNEHFLMVAHVGDEMKILMAVVECETEEFNETVTGVDGVGLYTPRGGVWEEVEVAEFGDDQVLFLPYGASAFCVTETGGGRGGRAYFVPESTRADSISRAQGLVELKWVEIDLVSGGVTYKGIGNEEPTKKSRTQSRLLFPLPPQQVPPRRTTRPWSKLPLRFVEHLLRRLQIPDYIRFSSVCHAWHVSKKRAQTAPAQQLPWLLLPRSPQETIVTYYSLSEDRTYHFDVPYIYGYDCIASIKGWLLFEGAVFRSRRFILNPLSEEAHTLSFTGFELSKVQAVAIMVPSSTADGGTQIFIATGNIILVWDLISSVRSNEQLNFSVLDMVAVMDNVYIVKKNLELVRYDPRTNEVTDVVVLLDVARGELPWPSKENDHYLVFAGEGEDVDILMVVVFYKIGVDDKTEAVDRLEMYVPCDGVWVRMPPEVFGDLVLFLGSGGSSVRVTGAEAGGRGRMACLVPHRERLESLKELGGSFRWVEFDLESGEVNFR